MHPIVLATAGYTLIFTSLVSLVILLRKSLKRCIGSSLHALTASDILSSVVTGVLLILNQHSQPIAGPFGAGGTNGSTDLGWIKLFDGDSEEPRVFVGSLGIPEENGTPTEDAQGSFCDFGSTAMQYAMFIFPFANAFVSLLSFSARASVDIDEISSRCRRMTSETGSEDSAAVDKDCTRKKNEIKIAGFGVIGQWIVPVLLAAVVPLAGQQRTDFARASIDMECIYGINFPFDNCPNSETTKIGLDADRIKHTTPLSNDYISSVDSTRTSGENSSREIDEVISKVNAIVGLVMNSTGSEAASTRVPSHYALSDLENITRIMESMSANDEDKNEGLYFTDSSEDGSDYSDEEPTTQIGELDSAEEMKLFESLMNRTEDSLEFFQEQTEANMSEVEPVTVNDYSEGSVNSENGTIATEREKTDNEIYADIVKKIHAVIPQLRPREKEKPFRENDRSRSKKNPNAYEKHREDTTVCAESGCFVSTRFLKIHLLVILFVVYFLPIFISALLQTRARYACLSVRDKIESSVGKEELDEKKSEASVEKSDRAGPSGWFPAVLTNEHEISASSSEDLVRSANFRELNYSGSVAPEERRKVDGEALRSIEEATRESERISELFGTALLLAVLLWTPIFLQILAKVFLCVDPGKWLMNLSFFIASLFGVARNILDLRMIRTREVIRNDGKMNTICPGS